MLLLIEKYNWRFVGIWVSPCDNLLSPVVSVEVLVSEAREVAWGGECGGEEEGDCESGHDWWTGRR